MKYDIIYIRTKCSVVCLRPRLWSRIVEFEGFLVLVKGTLIPYINLFIKFSGVIQ